MELPYYSGRELWREIGGANLGFYTRTTAKQIPNLPGVYAWFYPLDLHSDIASTISNLKAVFGYDSDSGLHKGEIGTKYVQWQAFRYSLQIVEDFKREPAVEQRWDKLYESLNDHNFKAIKQSVLLASIFARPLYVGLTARSLSSRYEEHVAGSSGNNFHRRFEDHMAMLGKTTKVKDLVFAAMPVSLPNLDGNSAVDRDFVHSLEYILKNVIGPIYSEK